MKLPELCVHREGLLSTTPPTKPIRSCQDLCVEATDTPLKQNKTGVPQVYLQSQPYTLYHLRDIARHFCVLRSEPPYVGHGAQPTT